MRVEKGEKYIYTLHTENSSDKKTHNNSTKKNKMEEVFFSGFQMRFLKTVALNYDFVKASFIFARQTVNHEKS